MTISVFERHHAVKLIAKYTGIVNKMIFQKGPHHDMVFHCFYWHATFNEKPYIDYEITLANPSPTRFA